jgi:uncharacterized protein (TIGR03083 family)
VTPPPVASVVAAARARRAPGAAIDGVVPLTPAAAFAEAVEDLRSVLDGLAPEQWRRPAHPAIGSVHDVIAHLVAVEDHFRELVVSGIGVAAEPTEHLATTAWAQAAFAGVPGAEVTGSWHRAATAFLEACVAAGDAQPVLVHDLPTDVDGLLVLRAFELWAHLQDVCLAVGRPVPDAGAARLRLMSMRLMGVVPVALLLRDVPAPADAVRFVLTGPGGGCYDVELGGPVPDGDLLTIVADTADLCRVAARRLPAADLPITVDGDARAAARLLSAIDAFARD